MARMASALVLHSRRPQMFPVSSQLPFDHARAGDYFSAGGLFTGSGETGAVQAPTATVVHEPGPAARGTPMRDRPSIADGISVTLSRGTKVGSSESGNRDEDGPRSVSWLVGRIRELFEVQHALARDLPNSGCRSAARRRSCRRHGIVEYWSCYDPGSRGSVIRFSTPVLRCAGGRSRLTPMEEDRCHSTEA